MSLFRDLLTIKSLRESKAERIVRWQREVLADATDACEKASKRLEDFVIFARHEEDTLYKDLCSRLVRLCDIENVQGTIAHLRQQEHNHEEVLRQAETQRMLESEKLAVDKRFHKEAARVKEKFVEWAQIHTDELRREFERREDAEMEEVAETRRDRAEWDESTDAEEPSMEATV